MRHSTKFYLAGGILFIIGILLGVNVVLLFTSFPEKSDLVEVTPFTHTVESKFVAVDEQGRGVTADLVTEIRPGSGLVLVNINDVLADLNTQYSARTAAAVASNYTKISLDNLDVIYKLQTIASIVGGQSAGTIMAVSTIAALQNKTLKQGVIATGSVNPAGEVVNAGGLVAKAQAAKNSNFSLFLVPSGLGKNPATFSREKSCNTLGEQEYCYVQYVGDEVSIGDEIGIEVQEVETVADAWRYFEL